MKKYTILILVSAVSILHRAEGAGDYVSWHPGGSQGWVVLFPVDQGGLVYRDACWAIAIERVQCDGVDILPERPEAPQRR